MCTLEPKALKTCSSIIKLLIVAVALVKAVSAQAEFAESISTNSGNKSQGAKKEGNTFYRAAVVEYEADENNAGFTSEEILWNNVENYEQLIVQASKESTDIIVFPEYGLTTLLAFSETQLQYIPEVGANPCQDHSGTSELIYRLSCAARTGKIYVVINLGEIATCDLNHCTTTAKDESRKYNTAVAFDRDGQIVAKYRKTHLFAEDQFVSPEIPSASTFTTDFGIEFGIFICFDILFEFPARAMVHKGIKHFIFPTAWIDELPFLTAVQAQMFWASASNVTLLGAGYHLPKFGKIGSGIFLPNGQSLNYTADPNSGTKVIYAQVPINGQLNDSHAKLTAPFKEAKLNKNHKSIDERFYYRENLANYTAVTLPLNFDEERKNVTLCDKDFCCHATYQHAKGSSVIPSTVMVDGNYEEMNYKLIVFNQTRKFTSPSVTKTMHLQICGIVRCLNASIESCAEAESSSVATAKAPAPVQTEAAILKQSEFGRITEITDPEVLPNFNYFQLSSSNFMLQDSKSDRDATKPAEDEQMSQTKPGFNTLDNDFNLIPAHLFDYNFSLVKNREIKATLSSNRIQNSKVQTLVIMNRVF